MEKFEERIQKFNEVRANLIEMVNDTKIVNPNDKNQVFNFLKKNIFASYRPLNLNYEKDKASGRGVSSRSLKTDEIDIGLPKIKVVNEKSREYYGTLKKLRNSNCSINFSHETSKIKDCLEMVNKFTEDLYGGYHSKDKKNLNFVKKGMIVVVSKCEAVVEVNPNIKRD
jgi:hypothetical protein